MHTDIILDVLTLIVPRMMNMKTTQKSNLHAFFYFRSKRRPSSVVIFIVVYEIVVLLKSLSITLKATQH